MIFIQKLLRSRKFAALLGAFLTIGLGYLADPNEPPTAIVHAVAEAAANAVGTTS